MPEISYRLVLRTSPAMTRLTVLFALAGMIAGGLYGAMALLSHPAELLVPVVLVIVVLVARPLAALTGCTVLDSDGITVRRPPLRTITVPGSQVRWIEVRRGLFTEWVVIHRRAGGPLRLRAPLRLWFRRDRDFHRGVGAIRARTGLASSAERGRLRLFRRLADGLLALAVIALILIDPPWQSDAWPLRPHAAGLPDACRAFDARAHQILPGARVDRVFSHSDDSDAHVVRHTCQWDSTYLSHGATVVGIDRLTIVYELDHGIGSVSDADEAHRTFRDDAAADRSEESSALPRTGDEARVITERPGGGFAAVTVAVRRANVEEKVGYVRVGRDAERQAESTAVRVARAALAKVRF